MGNMETGGASWEELGISNDFLFGKVMRDGELCKELLQRILPDLEIDHIEYPELQKEIKPDVDAKSVRLDVYVRGKHIYTFENVCKEDMDVTLGDGAVKIFLNADSEMDDVSRELAAFLDYVAGKETEDIYVEKLKGAVDRAKENREWRHEYMTLLMRDQENLEKGMEKGMEKGIRKGILAMVAALKDLNIPDDIILQKIQEKFKLSMEEAEKYL